MSKITIHGYPCEIKPSPVGFMFTAAGECGYVYLPPGHPWHGRYHAIQVDVHGGLTYAEMDTDGSWCIGFDTCHAFSDDVDMLAEVTSLAEQARAAARRQTANRVVFSVVALLALVAYQFLTWNP